MSYKQLTDRTCDFRMPETLASLFWRSKNLYKSLCSELLFHLYFLLQTCSLEGFIIAEGQVVAYISHTSNRDANVFKEPDTFRPERWTNE